MNARFVLLLGARRTARAALARFSLLAVFFAVFLGGVGARSSEASRVMVLSFSGGEGAKVQGAVSAALIGAGHDVSPGDTSFDDAAAVIGCDAKSEACAEQVLDALTVDEVVYGSSARSGDIVIVRVTRGKPRRQAKTRVTASQSMDAAVAPALRELYGESAPPPEPPAPPPPEIQVAARTRTSPFERGEGEDTVERPYRNWAIVAWGGAGAAAVTGLIFWVRASSFQDDIDRAPDNTDEEIDALEDLEDRAETASTWGNVMMVTAAGLAGAGTYLWMKDRRVRKSSTRASIQPTFFPGGAGILVTIGGDR